jgi:phage tail sheath protein FI
MFVIEKRIRSASKMMLFDPHDEMFHTKFINVATAILTEIKIGRGLYDFIIQCGWDINTPDVIDRNEFRAKIGVQPVKAVEFMFIEFSINRTGSWSENTEQPYTS